MFGFFRPSCKNTQVYRRYRQVYAALCAHHRQRYGLLPSALLSYESIFLYHLAIESGACSPPSSNTPTCCRLRNDSTNSWNLDQQLADFCSDFGLLLVRIKIEDDIRDSGSLVAKAALRLFRQKFALVDRRLNQIAKGTTARINDFVESHLAMESTLAPSTSFLDFAQPTANSFQLIFQAFGKLCKNRAGIVSNFGEIGSAVGQSILIGDCFFDFERDRSKGDFNPIRTVAEKEDARRFALASLSNLGWSCSTLNCDDHSVPQIEKNTKGSPARTPSVILELVSAAFERLSTRKLKTDFARTKKSRLGLMARGGFCDCDCDCGGCDGCDYDCCGCDSDDGNGCWFFNGCHCDACYGPSKVRQFKQGEEDGVSETKVYGPEEKSGITVGPLNPSGVINVDGIEHPAKSQSGFIESGKNVKIIKKEAFGFLVAAEKDT